jgi:hypothetical protein
MLWPPIDAVRVDRQHHADAVPSTSGDLGCRYASVEPQRRPPVRPRPGRRLDRLELRDRHLGRLVTAISGDTLVIGAWDGNLYALAAKE